MFLLVRRTLLVAAAALLALASPVAAQERTVDLTWRAPGECPEASAVRAEVGRLLARGSSAEPRKRPLLVARATVTRAAGVWRVSIETQIGGVSGERSFEGDSCASVTAATALILAMTLDPEAVRGVSEPPPEAVAAPAPVATPPPVVQSSPPPPEAPESAFALRPLLLSGVGNLPRAALGFGLAAGWLSGSLNAEVFFHYWLSRRESLSTGIERGGDFRLLAAGLHVCYTPHVWAATARLCAGGEVDRVDASGFGVTDPGTGHGLWVAPLAGVGVAWPLTRRVSVSLDIDVAFPLSRPQFVLVGIGPVWQPPAVATRAGLGVAVAF